MQFIAYLHKLLTVANLSRRASETMNRSVPPLNI